MTTESFATKYRLRTKKDECGDVFIPGKLGQLFVQDEDEGLVAAMFLPDEMQKGWTQRRAKLVAAGATVTQDGDTEGTVTFPVKDAHTVRLAMKLLGISARRKMSEEQRKTLADRLSKARAAKRG